MTVAWGKSVKRHTNIRADEQLLDDVRELARRERRSFASMVSNLLEEAIEARKLGRAHALRLKELAERSFLETMARGGQD